MRRFYIQSKQIRGNTAYLVGREAHHLRSVLRMTKDEKIVLFDGTGCEYDALIKSVEPYRINFKIVANREGEKEPRAKVTVAQALLKKGKMDTLIRQLTELGIHRWQPFISSRSIPRPSTSKQSAQTKRWETITIEAVKQCRRSRPPIVSPSTTFEKALASSGNYSIRIILWENATQPLHAILTPRLIQKNMPILLMLGPEGGFSGNEIIVAKDHGFVTASLGPRILRVETASLAAAVLVMHLMGDLG